MIGISTSATTGALPGRDIPAHRKEYEAYKITFVVVQP